MIQTQTDTVKKTRNIEIKTETQDEGNHVNVSDININIIAKHVIAVETETADDRRVATGNVVVKTDDQRVVM